MMILLILLIFTLTVIPRSLCEDADSSLYHIPVQKRPVGAKHFYAFGRRPWFSQLVQDHSSRSDDPSSRLIENDDTLLRFMKPTNVSDRTLFSNPVHGSITKLGEYYVTLTFGGQALSVQIDTGSSTMAVPLLECSTCRHGGRRLDLSRASGDAFIVLCDSSLCSAKSCTAKCGACSPTHACCGTKAKGACSFSLRYADQSGTTGALVQADVGISSLVTPLVFGAILDETASFSNDLVDGIFGLAYKSLACNPSCVTPLFDALVASGKIQRDIFSICTGAEGGVLTFGGSNPKLYTGSLQYVPLQDSSRRQFYLVSIINSSVGGKPVDLPHFSSAIVDSGTTLVIVSETTYNALRDYFFAHYCNVPALCPTSETRQIVQHPYFPHTSQSPARPVFENPQALRMSRAEPTTWFEPGYCVRLEKSDLENLPTISIHLDGYTLDLEPDVYMIPHYITRGFQKYLYYCLGIQPLAGLEAFPNDVILGDTVLQKYFVEYDRENSRVGFAVAKNCNDSSAVEPASLTEPSGPENPNEQSGWFRHSKRVMYLVGTIVLVIFLINCMKPPSESGGYRPISS